MSLRRRRRQRRQRRRRQSPPTMATAAGCWRSSIGDGAGANSKSTSSSTSTSISTDTGDNEAHFKVSTIQCDLIYNPISIIIDDDVCARFDHAMNLHINTNLCAHFTLPLNPDSSNFSNFDCQANAKQSSAIASLAVFQGNRNPETPKLPA